LGQLIWGEAELLAHGAISVTLHPRGFIIQK
jgi:hypothetical protein